MFKKITSFLRHLFNELFIAEYRPSENNQERPSSTETVSSVTAPHYPPSDRGIRLESVESVISSQQTYIDRIQKTAGLPKSEFEERFLPVITNIARYVHLLPATRTSHHRGAGGLFRLSLELGFYSLQTANSSIFIDKGSSNAESRLNLHPRWVYAAFIAGACSEMYRAVTDMIVTNSDGDKWPQFITPLYDWALQQNNHKYHIAWNTQDEADVIALNQATAAYIMSAIVPKEGMQYLNTGNNEIVPAMTIAITNASPNGMKNQIQNIIRSIKKHVIERDLKSNSERYGDFTVGSHLEPHLIDAMRKLLRKKTWEVNTKGARVWNSKDGTFIIWQAAAKEITAVLKESELPGIPSEADTLADILINAGVATPNNQEGRYWEICIPTNMQLYSAIRLQQTEVLFNDPTDLPVTTESLLPSMLVKNASNQIKKLDPSNHEEPKSDVSKDSSVEKAQTVETDQKNNTEPSSAPAATAETTIISENNTATANTVILHKITPVIQGEKKVPQEVKEGDSDIAEKLLNSLPAEWSDFLKAIIDDYKHSRSTGPIFSVAGGVAISTAELEAHGHTNYAGLVKVLSDKSWLWIDVEKPLKKLFEHENGGSKYKVIILKVEIARGLGFKWKQPK